MRINDDLKKQLEEIISSFERRVLEPDRITLENGLLYVLVGPSCAGKSTIIDYLIQEDGIEQLKKYSTRSPRYQDEPICQLTRDQIEMLELRGELVGVHDYNGNKYGVNVHDLEQIHNSNKVYLYDTCDPESAITMRKERKNLIKLIMVIPPIYVIQEGNKIRSVQIIDDEYQLNNIKRIKNLDLDINTMASYMLDMDYVITDDNYQNNFVNVTRLVTNDRQT